MLERWRKTLAWAELDETPTCFVADNLERPAGLDHEGPLAWTVRPMGRANSDFAQALINRHRAYPIGWGGEEAEWVLTVGLREEADSGIFASRVDEVYRWDFDPFADRLFDGPAAMFEAVDRLATSEDCAVCPAGMLGDSPPGVEFDLDAHLERGGAGEARGWMDDASLSAPLEEALGELVDAFSEVTFVRETERSLEYGAVINDRRLPDWYYKLRTTLAYVEVDGRPPGVGLARPSTLSGEWFSLGPSALYADMSRKLLAEYGHYPLMQSAHYFLSIRVDAPEDRAIYWSDVDEVDRDVFHESVAFESPEELFEAVARLQTEDGRIIERNGGS